MPTCLVPARSGSRRIVDKNITPIRGKPMMHHALTAAVQSGLFSRILVSTDSADYAEIALQVPGVEAFIRPADLATDHAPLEAVLTDAMQKFGGDEWCMFLPTAIDVTPHLLEMTWRHHQRIGRPVVTVTQDEPSPSPYRAMSGEHGELVPLLRSGIKSRTQDCGPTYHDAGQLYWVRAGPFLWRWLLLGHDILLQRPGYYVVKAVDIDTPADLERAARA